METDQLVVSALLAGAAANLSGSLSEEAAPTYWALVGALRVKFRSEKLEFVFSQFMDDPETWLAPLRKAIIESGAADDPQVSAMAEQILNAVDVPPHAKYNIIRGGGTVGSANIFLEQMGPPASESADDD